MNIKQSTLAAAMTAALAMGVTGQAAASVYGGSSLDIQNLTVALGNVGRALLLIHSRLLLPIMQL